MKREALERNNNKVFEEVFIPPSFLKDMLDEHKILD